jgi:hypothetical protein
MNDKYSTQLGVPLQIAILDKVDIGTRCGPYLECGRAPSTDSSDMKSGFGETKTSGARLIAVHLRVASHLSLSRSAMCGLINCQRSSNSH